MIRVGESDHKYMTDDITLRMMPSVMKEGKYWWDGSTVLLIDKRLKEMFDQQLVDYISMAKLQRGDIKESIELFMDYYGLSEDMISLETLIKMYYRARFYVPNAKKEKPEPQLQLKLQLA